MTQQWSLGDSIALALVTGFVPAIITGTAAYFAARLKSRDELDKAKFEFGMQQRGTITMLRQEYVRPLLHWARTLSARVSELEKKLNEDSYGEVSRWFQQLKTHMDGNQRMHGFPLWCCYEGIFVTTTLYYTCRYFYTARNIVARSPLGEHAPDYSKRLEEHLLKVKTAFGGFDGIWDSAQDVIGETFTRGERAIEHADICRIMDSRDEFQYAPLLRPVDFYISNLTPAKATAIRTALDELVSFLRSTPAPESQP